MLNLILAVYKNVFIKNNFLFSANFCVKLTIYPFAMMNILCESHSS